MNASMAERPRRLPGAAFRSHRTFRTDSSLVGAVAAFVLCAPVAYAALAFAWPAAMRAAAALAGQSASAGETYLGITYGILAAGMPALKAPAMLWTAAACGLAVLASALLPGHRTPLRYWLCVNALVLGGSALYAFFNGTVGYDTAPFMMLAERTGLVMLLAAPVFLTFVSALLPFTFWERAAMTAGAIALLLAVSVVRVAAFALLLGRFGAIVEANLYLFAGPLLDAVYLIAVYSVAGAHMSARVARSQEEWKWL